MNVTVNYIHQDGVSYNSENFNQAPGGNAIWDGASAAYEELEQRGLGGLQWGINVKSMPIGYARSKEGFASLTINSFPALVFQKQGTNLVVGVLNEVTLGNVRDVLVSLAPIQQVYSGGEIVNANGQVMESGDLDFPDSFNPFGLFKGPGWMFNLPGWMLWGIAAVGGLKATSKNTSTAGKVVFGTVGALAIGKALNQK